MTRREWLRRMGQSIPFLPALPAILSRAPRFRQLVERWEWEDRGGVAIATVIRLRTGEVRATMDRFSIEPWTRTGARLFHKAVSKAWIARGAPLTSENVSAMREVLGKPDIARSIRELARRP